MAKQFLARCFDVVRERVWPWHYSHKTEKASLLRRRFSSAGVLCSMAIWPFPAVRLP
jgi:hypothetical protein